MVENGKNKKIVKIEIVDRKEKLGLVLGLCVELVSAFVLGFTAYLMYGCTNMTLIISVLSLGILIIVAIFFFFMYLDVTVLRYLKLILYLSVIDKESNDIVKDIIKRIIVRSDLIDRAEVVNVETSDDMLPSIADGD